MTQRQYIRPVTLDTSTQGHPVKADVADWGSSVLRPTTSQRAEREYWKERCIQARANEIAWRNMQIHLGLSHGATSVKYKDLPLAE